MALRARAHASFRCGHTAEGRPPGYAPSPTVGVPAPALDPCVFFLWCHSSPTRIIPGVLSVRSGEGSYAESEHKGPMDDRSDRRGTRRRRRGFHCPGHGSAGACSRADRARGARRPGTGPKHLAAGAAAHSPRRGTTRTGTPTGFRRPPDPCACGSRCAFDTPGARPGRPTDQSNVSARASGGDAPACARATCDHTRNAARPVGRAIHRGADRGTHRGARRHSGNRPVNL
jgi:hypothetical protein